MNVNIIKQCTQRSSIKLLMFVSVSAIVMGIMPFLAHASGTITSVTLNGATNVVVEPGDSITVEVTVTDLNQGGGPAIHWKSTEYRFNEGPWSCVDTPDHSNGGPFSENFIVNVPNVPAIYDFEVRAYHDAGCGGSYTDFLLQDDAVTVEEPAQPAVVSIVATKIVCDSVADLPDWAAGDNNPPSVIDKDVAMDYVTDSNGACRFAEGWSFEWAAGDTQTNPGDDLVGPAGAPWTTFTTVTDTNGEAVLELSADDLDDNDRVWFREVLQSGYIPFTYGLNDSTNVATTSAEFYCGTDIQNYDNLEWIGSANDPITLGETYYCVAWNVPVEQPEETIEVCKYDYETQEPIVEWPITVTGGNEYEENFVTGEDGCVTVSVNPEYGPYSVFEGMWDGWEQEDVHVSGGIVEEGKGYDFCTFFAEDIQLLNDVNQYNCSFYNQPIPATPVCESGDNLLTNGSFEEPVATGLSYQGGVWQNLASIPGWLATNGFELWNNVWGGASEGDQNLELDVEEGTTITQAVNTVVGATYELRFDFSARPQRSLDDNKAAAMIDGVDVLLVEADGSNLNETDWTTYTHTFMADTVSTEVGFDYRGIDDNGHGALLDNAILCLVREAEEEEEEGEEEEEESSSIRPKTTGTRTDRGGAGSTPEPTVAGESISAPVPTPIVLGEQTSVVPYGGPATGHGGTSGTSSTNTGLTITQVLLGARRFELMK